jgi:subfamily B ATP-binding cassette protein HlyB/CyaB
VERLGDILNTPSEPRFNPARSALPAIRGDVTFDHVMFRYRIDGPEVLHDISFGVSAGQVVGIVGASGSGKSTVAKLIQRLYIPERGRVLVDGVDLAMVDTSWLRRQIGAVLQENVLFNQSIRDNIALPDPAMPIERVVEAAKLAGAHDFILELPEGYDTVVGERGASLSGGQQQRLCIARALAVEPEVLLMDEPCSALDPISTGKIEELIFQLKEEFTIVIVTHNMQQAARVAEKTGFFLNGRLVEFDSTHKIFTNPSDKRTEDYITGRFG